MGLLCKCGCAEFEPLGIQECWPSKDDRIQYRVIFLVNCLACGTTLATNRLDYALRRSEQTEAAVDLPFLEE